MLNPLRVSRRVVAISLAVLVAAAAAGTAVAATVTGPSASVGKIHVLATSQGNGAGGTILITGAIGDSGKTLSINKAGKKDVNGEYVKITLTKGTFRVNATKLDTKASHATPSFNSATCSAELSVPGPVTLSDGTGAYASIGGTVNVTITEGFVLPRFTSGAHKGQCDTSNAATPSASLLLINGSGTVTFG